MNNTQTTTYDKSTVSEWLEGMVEPLAQLVNPPDTAAMIGIRRGGVDVGRYLQKQLINKGVTLEPHFGELNISFYRDDFSTIGLHPTVGASQVPFDVAGKHIILVDDVLGTGRTVRAAMNEIFDYGRPSRISLVVLVQRAGHELPIRADVIGCNLDVLPNEYIDLDAATWQVHVGEKA